MASFLVTGTSRGLGLSLVKTLLSKPPSEVSQIIACTRSLSASGDLLSLIQSSKGRIRHVQIDLDNLATISVAVPLVADILGEKGLDYLVNNAAVRDPKPTELEDMDFLPQALSTNVVGLHEVIKSFVPLLRKGKAKKIVNFSSTLGQLSTAQTDPKMISVPFPAYKISKAGTHMVTALWSNRLKGEGFCVYIQSPGNLKTELAGKEKADLAPEVGAKEVIRIALEARPEDTGRHRNILVPGWEQGGGVGGRYDGEDLYW
ncbi:unnamed protein product [Clonostachys rosea]|uniref:NAD(P)-binding protein n=1 Tax=Bionectria ochroleuca TaxID=29856 RepID=A0ABY6U5N1_BIOOC|nr:unnamed protein product [Clonostachys rosea]